jgi:7-carboxy-7-deazaguanine synthase
MPLTVTEIFRSIQGESTYAGLPCIFVRLTGCNLRCAWCDTAYAFHGGTRRTIDEVLAMVHDLADASPAHGGKAILLVEITGGEPLIQPETPDLARRLIAEGFEVLVETSGERPIEILPAEVVKIVDVKCPDSGEFGTFRLENLKALGARDEVKFVIASRRDYEFASEFFMVHQLASRVHQVLFAPVARDPNGAWPGLEARDLADWVLADHLPVRINLQLHKFIWDPAMHGV